MIPVQIAPYGPGQEVTAAEAVITDGFKRKVTSLHKEANHRLLPTASTTATIPGAVQARPSQAAARQDQEAVEAVVPAVEAPFAVEDDSQASASSYPNNNTRVSLHRGSADF